MAASDLITDMAAQLQELSERERTLQTTRAEVLGVNTIRAIDWRTQAWVDLGLPDANTPVNQSLEWPQSVYGEYSCNDIADMIGASQGIDDAFAAGGGTIERLEVDR